MLSYESYVRLLQTLPVTLRQKLRQPSVEETKDAITNYMQSSDNNFVYNLINSDNPFYSVKSLRTIKATRINSSDLIRITYETQDAAIAKHTLELLTYVFMNKHKLLREGQTGSVITYFEKEVSEAFKRLDSCEEIFLDFNKQNDIINYYEQTKAVAGEKENLYALNRSLKMEENADEKAVMKVNDDIKGKVYQTLYGSDIIKQREELSNVYSNLEVTSLLGRGNREIKTKRIDSLKLAAANIERKLQSNIDNLNIQSNTPNGIPVKSILDEWVKKTINLEQSKARLTVMDKNKRDFAEEYRKLAPLGAMLKKIERQITVAEQEYLELLHGLNQARLTQQSNELTSKLTTVDPPYLPLKPNPSKRYLEIIIGFISTFLIVLAILLSKFLMNNTLQQPDKAFAQTGLPMLGIYPLLNTNEKFIQKANLKMMQQFLCHINLNKSPVIIGVISHQENEGKSTLIALWKSQLEALHYVVETYTYNKANSITPQKYCNIVFVEFAAIENIILTPGEVPDMDNYIMVCRANRLWNKIDDELLRMFRKNTNSKPLLVLNGVAADFAEDFIGEIPKKRTILREMVRKIVRMEIGNRKDLKRA